MTPAEIDAMPAGAEMDAKRYCIMWLVNCYTKPYRLYAVDVPKEGLSFEQAKAKAEELNRREGKMSRLGYFFIEPLPAQL